MVEEIVEKVRTSGALVHNITNYVTVNDCANIILACGASPIMADSILEVEEIVAICDCLVINIGTLNERTIESMIVAGKRANELNIPVVLDPVGVGASKLRTDSVLRLLAEVRFSVIRGNISEIKTIAMGSGKTSGVDANLEDLINEDNLKSNVEIAKMLSKKYMAVVAISGAIDIIASSDSVRLVHNGNAMMSRITGSGCMLTALIGAFIARHTDNLFDATTTAVISMGVAGEYAYRKSKAKNVGTATFRNYLIDYVSTLTAEEISEEAEYELYR